jgi:hypothetical protein
MRPRVQRGSSWSVNWLTRTASRGGRVKRYPPMERQVAWPSSITSSLVSWVIRLTSIPNSRTSAPPTRRSKGMASSVRHRSSCWIWSFSASSLAGSWRGGSSCAHPRP